METEIASSGPDLRVGTPRGRRAVLADGTAITVRPIGPSDAMALMEFHEELSPESQYRRFFSPHPHLSPAEADRFANVDHCDREALAVTHCGRIIAVGRYDRESDTVATAEVAFTVADHYQHHGIARLLFESLAELARARGVHRLRAMVLAGNSAMLTVFLHSGYQVTRTLEDGVVDVLVDIDLVASG